MKCRFLEGRNVKQCRAVTCTVVLSGCELADYCESGNFERCPVFRAVEGGRGRTITLHDYCRIYSDWTRGSGVAKVAKSA